MSRLPLEGVRIADFTQVVQGPYGTMMMAVMGAEVLKMETASRYPGDSRDLGPFVRNNVSKKSISIDFKDPRGVALAKEIVKISDLVVENFGTGVIERLGLGYEDLKKVKPDVIMLCSTGLGRRGPYKNAIGYYAEVANFAGLSYLSGYKEGKPGQVAGIWADHLTGMLIVFAALAALRHHRKTGQGQYIEMCMAENVIAALPERFLDFTVNGRLQPPQENRDPWMAPHSVYRCDGFDKWVAIAVSNDEEWASFCQATGHPEWADNPLFADSLSRWHNQEELDKLITEWTSERTNYEVMHILQEAGVAAGPSLNAEGLVNDPHLIDRGRYIPLGVVEGNPYTHLAQPWRMSDAPTPDYHRAPNLGEHNTEVLRDLLGMSEEEIAHLTDEGVLK